MGSRFLALVLTSFFTTGALYGAEQRTLSERDALSNDIKILDAIKKNQPLGEDLVKAVYSLSLQKEQEKEDLMLRKEGMPTIPLLSRMDELRRQLQSRLEELEQK